MAPNEYQNFMNSLEAIQKKWFIRKLWIAIIALITLGMYIQDWRGWRSKTSTDISELQSDVRALTSKK